MLHLVREIRDRNAEPSFEALGAMIYYIDAFPERFHHPKEDRYLFRTLRARYPDAAPLIDRLEEEHRVGAHKIRTLEQALARYQSGGQREFRAVCRRGRRLRGVSLEAHARRGERADSPCEEQLTAEDWAEIDKAFSATPIRWSAWMPARSTATSSRASSIWRRRRSDWGRLRRVAKPAECS
jgi:hemerythrin-like domain-containing protein